MDFRAGQVLPDLDHGGHILPALALGTGHLIHLDGGGGHGQGHLLIPGGLQSQAQVLVLQVNREAAGEAAAYVRPEARGEVLAALENALEDVSWRRTMQERERRRAELFSEYAVAERLMQIYTSL